MAENPPDIKKKSEKVHLHTTLNPETFSLLKELSLTFGSNANALEKAIRLLATQLNETERLGKDTMNEFELSNVMRNSLHMLMVGRRTFLSYINDLPQAPIQENNGLELIEWYYNQSINKLSLFQILKAIKAIWMAAHYFKNVIIEPKNSTTPMNATIFKVTFYHDFNTKKYGEYWTEYIKYMLEREPINCVVEREIRNEIFYLYITQKELRANPGA